MEGHGARDGLGTESWGVAEGECGCCGLGGVTVTIGTGTLMLPRG